MTDLLPIKNEVTKLLAKVGNDHYIDVIRLLTVCLPID